MESLILNECKSLYHSYNRKVGRIRPSCGCMLKAENFCFCVISEMFNIDIIIESGLCHGSSTEMFAKYFSDKKIYSIDTEIIDSAKTYLSRYDNIEILKGDGLNLVEQVISENKGSRIAVFIDGPKGRDQLVLAKRIINDVEFVALHDVGKVFSEMERKLRNDDYDPYKNFMEWDKSMFITTDEWYAKEYSHMNNMQLRWLQGKRVKKWRDRKDGYDSKIHNPILEAITPIGFGLGIAIK